jgi:thiamine biosynthesis lipoprotein
MAVAMDSGLRRVEHVMGMPIVVDVRDEGAGTEVVDSVFDWLRSVDAVFSTYRPDSEISRIDRGELAPARARADVQEVLARCEELRRETRGYFDVHASANRLDPSGLVKGWSVDRAAAILERAGVRNYAVNAGGDIRLRGRAVPELCWRVGIQHPRVRQAAATVLELTEAAVATSGGYARGAHVLDPHTGRAPEGVLSVTVVGRELATADAYATAAYAMGPVLGPHWAGRLDGFESMTILADGSVLSTPGFPT